MLEPGASREASRRTAGCTCPKAFPHFVDAPVRRRDRAAPRSPSACSRRSPTGDPLAGELGAICREAFNFPAPLVPLAQCAGARVGARAVSWPDLRVQGFRRALSRGVRWNACAAGATAQADHPRRDFRRHRRRGRRGVPQPALGRRGRAVSRRARVRSARRSSSPAGAATCGRSRCTARSTTASAW